LIFANEKRQKSADVLKKTFESAVFAGIPQNSRMVSGMFCG